MKLPRTCISTDHTPRTFPVAPGIPLYCTKDPGQLKYLKPMLILTIVWLKTWGIQSGVEGIDGTPDIEELKAGMMSAVGSFMVSRTMPMITETMDLVNNSKRDNAKETVLRITIVHILIVANQNSYSPYLPRKLIVTAATS